MLGPGPLDGDPGVRLRQERMHLREHRARGRLLPLKHLDPPQSPHDRPSLVHAVDASRETRTRVWPDCAESVTVVSAVAPNPDRELAEARACIDRGDEPRALKHLDRARRGYVKQHNVAGLEHLFVLADVLDTEKERTRDGRENLVYAIQQNVRSETRRIAQLQGRPWQDPYPDLRAPTEHTRISPTRGVKIAIGVGVVVATAAIVAFFAVPAVEVEVASPVTLRLVNDTRQPVVVADCLHGDCSVPWRPRRLKAGGSLERIVTSDRRMLALSVTRPGRGAECLSLHVRAGYKLAGSDPDTVLVARLSRATLCPGTPVVPKAAPTQGL